MLGQMGRSVDHIADEIKPAPFDIAFSQQQSAGMDARMHSQRQTSRRQPSCCTSETHSWMSRAASAARRLSSSPEWG